MEKEKIERINFLAKKAKTFALTDEEKAEQSQLRQEYRNSFRNNFETVLDNTYVVHDEGKKERLIKRKGSKNAD